MKKVFKIASKVGAIYEVIDFGNDLGLLVQHRKGAKPYVYPLNLMKDATIKGLIAEAKRLANLR